MDNIYGIDLRRLRVGWFVQFDGGKEDYDWGTVIATPNDVWRGKYTIEKNDRTRVYVEADDISAASPARPAWMRKP